MARTSRAGNASKPAKPRLNGFDKGLVIKNVTTDALQQSLQDLATQLIEFRQDQVDLTSIDRVKPTLVDRKLLLHKDKGVKAYLCVCLAEVLRLYAPEAPYTQDELLDIFQFLFRQLNNISSQTAYFDQYHHVLESLSEVKSIVLVCDVARGDEVVVEIFKDCFSIIKKSTSFFGGGGLPRKVEMYIADILAAILDESSSIPDKVLDLLLAPFTESPPGEAVEAKGKLRDTTKGSMMDHSAGPSPHLRVAAAALNATKDKLQRNIGIHFTDIIVKTSTSVHYVSDEESDTENEGEKDVGGLSPKQVREIEAAHLVIRNLHTHCPGVLTSVIPQLEEELRAEDLDIRETATATLGKMYTSAPLKGADLVRSHPSTWVQWMQRRNDKSAHIRTVWASFIKGLLLIPGSEVRATIQEAISVKMHDPDEKMRIAVIQNFGSLDYETALRHVDTKLLLDLAGRGLDRKHSVRYAALVALGRLWDLAYPEIASNDPQARQHFGWIPGELLGPMYKNTEVRPLIEEVAHTFLFPLPVIQEKGKDKEKDMNTVADEALSRSERLLTTMKLIALSPAAEAEGLHEVTKLVERIMAFSNLRSPRPTLYQIYLQELSSTFNDSNSDQKNKSKTSPRLDICIQQLSISLASGVSANAQKISEDLHSFAKLGDQKLIALLKKACELQIDIKSLAKLTHDLQTRLQASDSSLCHTMEAFLKKGSMRIVTEGSIPPLLERLTAGPRTVTESQSQMTTIRRDTISSQQLSVEHAREILLYVAKWRPELYKNHMTELLEILDDDMAADNIREVALTALAAVAKLAPDHVRDAVPEATHNAIRTLVLHTTNWRLAKFGARYLAFAGHMREEDGELVNEDTLGVSEAIAAIWSSALEKTVEESGEDIITDDYVLSHVTVLVQFARFARESFETRSEVFVQYFTKRILMMTADEADRDQLSETDEWINDSDMSSFLRAKIQSIKALRHRCLSFSTDERAVNISKPILTMLLNIVNQGGSIIEAEEDPRALARMRLQAAVSLLHICTVKVYMESLGPYFSDIAFMAQDTCFEVRFAFMHKLIPKLVTRRLDPKFNIIPFLSAPDPEMDSKTTASAYVTATQTRMSEKLRLQYFEVILPRMLELLARHPGFSASSVEDFEPNTLEIQMYIDLVANQENIGLLYHLAGKCKTVKTKEASICENFWILSEMTQELMKIHAHRKGWNITNYPGSVRLPQDIFVAFSDSESTNKNIRESYTPHALLAWLQEEITRPVGRAGTKRKAGAPPGETKKKGTKRRKSGGSDLENDSGGEEHPSSDVPMEDVDEVKTVKPPSKKKNGTPKDKSKRKKKGEDDDVDASEDDFKPSGRVAPAPPKTEPRRTRHSKQDKSVVDIETEDEEDNEGTSSPEPVQRTRSLRTRRRKDDGDVDMAGNSDDEEPPAPKSTPRSKGKPAKRDPEKETRVVEEESSKPQSPSRGRTTRARGRGVKSSSGNDIEVAEEPESEEAKRPRRASQRARPSPQKKKPRGKKRESSVDA